MKSNKAASAAAFHNKTIKAEESVVWLRWSSSSSCFKWVPIEAFPSNNHNLLVMMAFVMIFCRRCNTPLNVLWSAKIWLRWSRHSSVDPLSVLWTRVRSPSPPSMLFRPFWHKCLWLFLPYDANLTEVDPCLHASLWWQWPGRIGEGRVSALDQVKLLTIHPGIIQTGVWIIKD